MKDEIKILIVDDAKVIRSIIKKFLNELGFNNITEARDGSEGLKHYKNSISENEQFHLIITDWNMPFMSGLEFVKKVREIKEELYTKIIMVTAETTKESVKESVLAGVDKFIAKPFSIDKFKSDMDELGF
jgi:two-component system chemotaxis response regulator CheY